MITVGKKDGLSLKISHIVEESKQHELEMFLFVPGELGLNKDMVSESEFYYNSIQSYRTYFSDKNHLPLVHSRLAQRGRLSTEQYRLSLSLYAYQYALALEKAIQQLSDTTRDDITHDEVEDAIELAIDILRKLRRNVPYDDALKRYYANIDNYLSWYTEQKFLSLIAHMPRNEEYKEIKEKLIDFCEKEDLHRLDKSYNSRKAREDMTRMSNKMRLLRRLIEFPIVLKEKNLALGKHIKRMVKGGATAVVMIFVSLMVIQARGFLGEITASFIFAVSFIYAMREVFKDDLRDVMWRWIRKGQPKWRKRYLDPTTNTYVGRKLEWLDYMTFSELDSDIQKLRKHRVVQREEVVLSYKSQTKMAITKFMSGYEQTRETMLIDLRPIARLMEKGSQKIYQLNEGQVSKESVEKRHLINLIVRETMDDYSTQLHRWKIIVNRSKIIDIEKIAIDK
ncbi:MULTISPECIES: hypothetical protein [Aliivibrio]|uniref:Uncharacterized protein n=1 Tax=Aliivibrio finisterrensis TaxID=511998 RepID=A0A4Q5KTR4_9GAMM|nr:MULTISPECIES: hypothetical protein [Aliivibrio]MDD9178763.1 hypothetical protein [Aliivibrio sp. A6]RYU49601.1 hypothetical protein ERW57_14710 [Aliivibrio finisterrensis]RYU50212.1 hypothetical protein ERW56_15220 [Aliivibrio finisterrensis]RYU55937.1 hypothetical protein ERW50_15275 [Aliivibrio finisterrensis]RYU62250.1 hypothetical protein ERW53_16330 [Aliivibrio finisterrensis]